MTLKRFFFFSALLAVCFSLKAQDKITFPMPDGSQLHVIYYGNNILRLFQDPLGGPVRDPQANPPASILVPDAKKPAPEPVIGVNVKDGRIIVKNGTRTVLEQDAPTAFEDGRTRFCFRDGGGFNYYGGGVQNGRFSHAGKTIAIENQNSWTDGGVSSPAPWFWSTGGYGILWHTFAKGSYTFGEEVKLVHDTPYLDIFVFVDDEPSALLRDYYQLTGNPVLLPKFGFYEGHLNAYNRDFWAEADGLKGVPFEDGKRYVESQKDNGGIKESLNGELPGNYQFSARAVVDRYEAADMPLGWILPNDGYGAGYGQTETLDGNIENLRSFGDYARGKGVEIGLWTQSDLHPVDSLPALLQRDIEKEVGTAGVRVLKTDVAWVGWGYSFGLNGIADAAGIMAPHARPFIITLDGWAGTQRYGGIWSGDQTGGQWEYIRFHIPTYIGAGLSGQPNVGSDMDGIFGGGNLFVNVRDFQWKTFTPMELNMDGWGANEKYPQALGPVAAVINRKYLKLKSELMPYTYSIAHEAVSGLPMVRAVSLEYPSAQDRLTQYEFLYGPYFLVAPVYKETRPDGSGNDQRDGIYLPEGLWLDWFTGLEYKGGQVLNSFPAPLDKLPVFVKRGAIVPMTGAHNNPSQQDLTLRTYTVFPFGSTSFTEYDDDGRTTAYLDGQFSRTVVSQSLRGSTVLVEVAPTTGSFDKMVKFRTTVIRIHTAGKPGKVKAWIDNRPVTPTVTYVDGFANVELPKASVYADIRISMAGFKEPLPALAPEKPSRSVSETPELIPSSDAITLRWKSADVKELDFQGVKYTNILGSEYVLDGLEPLVTYTVGYRSGNGQWGSVEVTTLEDPLANAISGIAGTCSAPSQGGQGIENLFDFSTSTEMWHTVWSGPSVPFEITADLGAIYQLDYLEYVPRPDAGNGTILRGSLSTSVDGTAWSTPLPVVWERSPMAKKLPLGGREARFVKLSVDAAVGGFGSGKELYLFKVPGTQGYRHGVFNERGEAVESL